MKKRNRVLEILLCTALAAVVFLAYMVTAEDKGRFEIVDKEGDRAYLEEFSFEGLAGDETGQLHYVWKDGELTTTYYPMGASEVDDVLYPLKQGKTGLGRYFKELENNSEADFEIEAAPSSYAAVRKLTKMEELQEDIKASYNEDNWAGRPMTLNGVEADTMDIYTTISDYTAKKKARFFTGLQFTGKPYQIVRFEYRNGQSSMIPTPEYMEQLGIFGVELEDAWFSILQTGKDCEGEVFLLRIPKDKMVSTTELTYDWDALYSTETFGTADACQTFDVSADNRIIALEKAGKDRLLLARTEQNVLLLELYDAEGNLLHQLKTDTVLQEGSEFGQTEMIQREDQLLLQFQLEQQVMEEDDVYHYEVLATKYFIVEQDTIKALPNLQRSAYTDYQNGKILQMQYVTPVHLAADYWGYMPVGYTLKVTDAESGEELYCGELVTDFTEDYTKNLSAINIGTEAGFIKGRDEEKNWDKYAESNTGKRTFSNILPVDGERYSSNWQKGHRAMYFSNEGYYHYG